MFEGSRLKIRRAQELVSDFEEYERRHFEIHPPNSETKITNKISITFKVDPVDRQTSLLIGDVIHNLRTALDLMATDLVRNRGNMSAKAYFPFAASESELDEQIKKKNFHLAGEESVLLLKRFAPYPEGNKALRELHDLDIQDKHKELINHNVSTISQEIMFGKNGPELMPGSNATASFVFNKDTIFADQKVIPTLQQLVQLILSILDEFEKITSRT